MASAITKGTSQLQLAAFYYVLIATYFIAGSPASSATETAGPQRLPIRQTSQQQHLHGESISANRERTRDSTKSRDFLFDQELQASVEESVPSTTNLQDLSHLAFVPSLLDFGELSVGDANSEVVMVVNRHPNKSVYLGSISGYAADFYSSFFEDKVIVSSLHAM